MQLRMVFIAAVAAFALLSGPAKADPASILWTSDQFHAVHSAAPEPATLASLQVATDSGGELAVSILSNSRTDRTSFEVDCISNCKVPLHFLQQMDASPLGLFKRWDGDDLVYSIWVGGVAYSVVVWSVADGGVRQVFNEASRGMPDFLTDSRGRQIIRTYERPLDVQGRELSVEPAPVLWRLENGRFVRIGHEVR